MGWFSILPESFSTVESWIVRICLLFALLIGGPWLLMLIYDVFLYFWRSATYELPYIGGRTRGRQRPRAPSLTERPSGNKRKISLASVSREAAAVATGKDRNASSNTISRMAST